MSEIVWEDMYRAETQATKELERDVERLSKRQKEDEEAFWEERDARVELQARVEELDAWKTHVLGLAVSDEVPKLLPYLRSEWVKAREQAKADCIKG